MSPASQTPPVRQTAVVAGATGAVAKRLIEVLARDPRWNVIGLSRNAPASSARMRHATVDLLDPADCRRRLEPFNEVTHLFYCARAKHGEGGTESLDENVAMLRNVFDAVEAAAPGLQHVHLVEWLKWYGVHPGHHRHREHVSTALCASCGSSAHGHIIELARMTVIVADFLTGMGRRNRRGSARRVGPRLDSC